MTEDRKLAFDALVAELERCQKLITGSTHREQVAEALSPHMIRSIELIASLASEDKPLAVPESNPKITDGKFATMDGILNRIRAELNASPHPDPCFYGIPMSQFNILDCRDIAVYTLLQSYNKL